MKGSIARTRILLVLCMLALTVPRGSAGQRSVFKSTVEMVALTVTVTDGKGRCVSGLTEGDFVVFEDGIQQTVSLFGSDEIPVDVALVLDTSGSMIDALPVAKEAARALVDRLRRGDRAAVIDVNTSTRIPQSFTEDRASIAAAIDAVSAKGSTALYDGVYTSLHEFERLRRKQHQLRRHTLVVLSDGFDTASHVSFDDVTQFARALDVTIYTIALRTTLSLSAVRETFTARATWEMRTLATETGGLVFFPTKAVELQGIYNTIARELTHQYALGYVPSAPRHDRPFRRVALKLLPPKEGIPRTRSGYIPNGTGLYRIPPASSAER